MKSQRMGTLCGAGLPFGVSTYMLTLFWCAVCSLSGEFQVVEVEEVETSDQGSEGSYDEETYGKSATGICKQCFCNHIHGDFHHSHLICFHLNVLFSSFLLIYYNS